MAAKLGVLVIHGIGDQDARFHEKFVNEVRGRIKDRNRVVFEPIHWAPVLSERAKQLWQELKKDHNLNFANTRKILINYVADASAYQQVSMRNNVTYESIHALVHRAVQGLLHRVEGGDSGGQAPLPQESPSPILVVAHSLGCHIMSNYIWDRQHWKPAQNGGPVADPFGGTAFERMETLIGMVTFGCNLPFFTLAFDPVLPITLPGKAIPAALKPLAKWLNYFDPEDVLGWPVKPLFLPHVAKMNRGEKETVDRIEDRQINVGGLLKSWNPVSHRQYWTDNDFTKPVAAYIDKLVEGLG